MTATDGKQTARNRRPWIRPAVRDSVASSPCAVGELAVVTCFFNPCEFATRFCNFADFYKAAKSQGADIHIIEARETGGFWQLPDDLPNLHRVEFGSRLWQKERLLNILIERLPDRYTKVAWVDCDVLWDNPDWVSETNRLLDDHQVLQLFDRAAFLSPEGVPMRGWSENETVERIGVAAKRGAVRMLGTVHPGFAWAGRREWLDKIGLWDRHVVGSGDAVMCRGFWGWSDVDHTLTSPAVIQSAAEWCEAATQLIGGSVGHVPGLIRHLWHGSRADRRYDERLFFTKLDKFDPARDLVKNSDGCWEWSKSANPEIVAHIREYFASRREDG